MHSILEDVCTQYISEELMEGGLPRAVPAEFLSRFPRNDFLVWCHRNAIYQYPTVELVSWLRGQMAGQTALEIGAGNVCLGRFLAIPMADTYYQTHNPEIRQFMGALRQPPTSPQPGVDPLDAIAAIDKYNPSVVIGSWITHRYNGTSGLPYGVDSLQVVSRCKYVLLGNLHVAKGHPLFERSHTAIRFPWLVSRAHDPAQNRAWVWDKQKVEYPRPLGEIAVGRSLPDSPPDLDHEFGRCLWCAQDIQVHRIRARIRVQLCIPCAVGTYGPALVKHLLTFPL